MNVLSNSNKHSEGPFAKSMVPLPLQYIPWNMHTVSLRFVLYFSVDWCELFISSITLINIAKGLLPSQLHRFNFSIFRVICRRVPCYLYCISRWIDANYLPIFTKVVELELSNNKMVKEIKSMIEHHYPPTKTWNSLSKPITCLLWSVCQC